MQDLATYGIVILILQSALIMLALWFIIKKTYSGILWGIRRELVYLVMGIRLLFTKKIIIKVHPNYSSIHQWTDNYYLLKIIKCSDQRYFKVISGDFVTVVPESAIQEIDGIEPKNYTP